MTKNIRGRLIILLAIPFMVTCAINFLTIIGINIDSSILLFTTTMLLRIWGVVGVVFWVYVGKQFGNLNISKVKSFTLGNSLWMISLLLYVWQFILLDISKRNFFIAGISQYYSLSFVSVSNMIISLFNNGADSTMVTIVAYIIMLIIFVIGFTDNPKDMIDKEST